MNEIEKELRTTPFVVLGLAVPLQWGKVTKNQIIKKQKRHLKNKCLSWETSAFQPKTSLLF